MKVTIDWSGSFQCRLATDPGPSNSSPTIYSATSGWTIAYGEPAFDRLIRLQSPVSLRTALVDSWEDTKVTSVVLSFPDGSSQTDETLKGKKVSYGTVVFDGPIPAQETLKGLEVSIGTSGEFTGKPSSPAQLTGAKFDKTRQGLYEPAKKAKLSQVKNPVRLGTIGTLMTNYAAFYGFWAETGTVTLNATGTAEFLRIPERNAHAVTEFNWEFSTKFFAFDGDTLTGRITGQLIGNLNPAPAFPFP
ncbi:MAG: hypothetical protein R3C19_05525 [Planctomycetaceae bacterium]